MMARVFITMLALVAVFVTPAKAEPDAQAFVKAVEAYDNGRYEDAALGFEKTAASGAATADLYYDAGNSWFKAGRCGRAILWYERALLLDPTDPELRFNLDMARAKVLDQQPEATGVGKILFFWKDAVPPSVAVVLALALGAVFWSLLAARMVMPRSFISLAASVCLAGCLFFTAVSVNYYFTTSGSARAVVLAPEAEVRSGLAQDSTKLFTLREGSVVQVRKFKNFRALILFGDGQPGWVDRDAVGVI